MRAAAEEEDWLNMGGRRRENPFISIVCEFSISLSFQMFIFTLEILSTTLAIAVNVWNWIVEIDSLRYKERMTLQAVVGCGIVGDGWWNSLSLEIEMMIMCTYRPQGIGRRFSSVKQSRLWITWNTQAKCSLYSHKEFQDSIVLLSNW